MRDALKRKIKDLADRCRANGYTQPVDLELTIPELRELDAFVNPPKYKSPSGADDMRSVFNPKLNAS